MAWRHTPRTVSVVPRTMCFGLSLCREKIKRRDWVHKKDKAEGQQPESTGRGAMFEGRQRPVHSCTVFTIWRYSPEKDVKKK